MAAAVITATMAQTSDVPSSIISGSTERRLKRLYIEGPKATQNDWFLLSTYLGTTNAANVLHARATTIDSGNAVPLNYLYTTGTTNTGYANISTTIASAGVSGTDKNLQPYVVVYMWKRTA